MAMTEDFLNDSVYIPGPDEDDEEGYNKLDDSFPDVEDGSYPNGEAAQNLLPGVPEARAPRKKWWQFWK